MTWLRSLKKALLHDLRWLLFPSEFGGSASSGLGSRFDSYADSSKEKVRNRTGSNWHTASFLCIDVLLLGGNQN
ncbi:MAG: hypothetical protein DME60_06205 [Verrucomicrobia bacterium]|nr:MAG: hypothetical protein DME60_06205 [Verrucomicrobiota bacterium]